MQFYYTKPAYFRGLYLNFCQLSCLSSEIPNLGDSPIGETLIATALLKTDCFFDKSLDSLFCKAYKDFSESS
jgi:hypothetical protein